MFYSFWECRGLRVLEIVSMIYSTSDLPAFQFSAKFTETPTNMKAMASQAIGILYDAGKSIFNPFSSIWV